jgi:hypothetical protein
VGSDAAINRYVYRCSRGRLVRLAIHCSGLRTTRLRADNGHNTGRGVEHAFPYSRFNPSHKLGQPKHGQEEWEAGATPLPILSQLLTNWLARYVRTIAAALAASGACRTADAEKRKPLLTVFTVLRRSEVVTSLWLTFPIRSDFPAGSESCRSEHRGGCS